MPLQSSRATDRVYGFCKRILGGTEVCRIKTPRKRNEGMGKLRTTRPVKRVRERPNMTPVRSNTQSASLPSSHRCGRGERFEALKPHTMRRCGADGGSIIDLADRIENTIYDILCGNETLKSGIKKIRQLCSQDR